MLGVEALDSEAATWTRGRRLGRFNQRMTAYDLVTAADGFAGEAEDVAVAIRRYRDDPERRRHIGDEGELTQLRELLGERVAPA